MAGEVPPHVLLECALSLSGHAVAWEAGGELVALSGACEIQPGVADPWMMGTDAMFGVAKWPFLRASRPEWAAVNKRWPILRGHVHAANTAHVRWLEWCGFTVSPPICFGLSQDLFHPFERRA